MNVAKQATDAIRKVNGMQYEYGSASRMLCKYINRVDKVFLFSDFIHCRYQYSRCIKFKNGVPQRNIVHCIIYFLLLMDICIA